MSAPQIPEGFQFGSMSVHAESWEAYDALTEEAGWTERYHVNEDKTVYWWKTFGPWPSGYVAAHQPVEPRSSSGALDLAGWETGQ